MVLAGLLIRFILCIVGNGGRGTEIEMYQVFVESSMCDELHDEEDEVDASCADAHPRPIFGQVRD